MCMFFTTVKLGIVERHQAVCIKLWIAFLKLLVFSGGQQPQWF